MSLMIQLFRNKHKKAAPSKYSKKKDKVLWPHKKKEEYVNYILGGQVRRQTTTWKTKKYVDDGH